MIAQEERQEVIDNEQMRLLSFFYYVTGVLSAICVFFPLFYVFMGLLFLLVPGSSSSAGSAPPALVGWIFITLGLSISLLMLATAILKICAGYCIARRTRRTLCLVAAGFSCFGIPYGTLLGIFTFIVLSRESVVGQFERATAVPANQGSTAA